MPNSFSICIVAFISSASSKLVISDLPIDMDDSIRARWDTDLSPGILNVPNNFRTFILSIFSVRLRLYYFRYYLKIISIQIT